MINNSLKNILVSYPIKIDEKLSAFILKNKITSIRRFKNLFLSEANKKEGKTFIWINNPQYSFDISALEDYNKLFLQSVPIFISGCNERLAHFFQRKNFEILKVGQEAVLHFNKNHFGKKSIKELIRAGKKNNLIEELIFSEDNYYKLEEFKKHCAHGDEPQLKHFFNDVFRPNNRLMILKNKSGFWLGGILFSCVDDKKVRTDLLLRRKNAPRGVMEALIKGIFDKLKNENYKTWSLGEVPYVVYGSKIFSKEFLINFAGRKLRFAYNYLGLYNFKNKFNPEWGTTYICCKPKLSLGTIVKVSWMSNLVKLIIKKAFRKFFRLA